MIERDKEYYNQMISKLYSIIENHEKIIRDLQEEVKGYQTMYFDKVMIVNKAIEEINHYDTMAKHIDDNIYLDEELANNLLKILRGEDKE